MHKIIIWVRHLRRIAVFKISTRTIVLTLMLLGVWAATYDLEIPLTFDLSDKVIHAVVFFGFAFLMDLTSSRHPFWLWKGLPLLLYGVGIEVLQYFTPFRSFSLLDILADFFGVFLYFLIKVIAVFYDNRS